MPEELLELETPEEVEQPIEENTPEGSDAAEQPAEGAEGDKPPVTSLFQSDGKKLDPQVSSALSKLKTESPEIGKLLSKAVYRVAELDREFPGGIAEARELRDKVEELGGVLGIEQKLEGLAELDGLAKQFMDADPAFIDDLLASSPESFSALAPQVMNKFAEVNKDAFEGYIGRIVYGAMQSANLPLMMMRLGDVLGDNPKALEAYNAVNQYLGIWKTLAEKPAQEFRPKPTEAKRDEISKREENISKREEKLRAEEWQDERDQIHRTLVNSEYGRCLAGRKPDTEEKAEILELFRSRAKTKADELFPGWQKKSDAYIQRDDKAGYLRYMKSIYSRVVPDVMGYVVNRVLRGKRAEPAKVVKPATQSGVRPVADATWKPVAKEPDRTEIDWRRTSTDLLMANKAVLNDGRKVQWR